jgi:hypothetical protein
MAYRAVQLIQLTARHRPEWLPHYLPSLLTKHLAVPASLLPLHLFDWLSIQVTQYLQLKLPAWRYRAVQLIHLPSPPPYLLPLVSQHTQLCCACLPPSLTPVLPGCLYRRCCVCSRGCQYGVQGSTAHPADSKAQA